MITKRSAPYLLAVTFFTMHIWADMPFGMGQNMKKPDFSGFQKKEKKGTHKNPLTQKPLAELKTEKDTLVARKDYETAAKYLDAMRMVATDTEELKQCLLQMADLYFIMQDWAKAERAYQEFVMLYPGAEKYEYAYAQAAKCGKKLISEPDRDQSKTEEVLKFCQEFIDTHKTSDYLTEITQIATECRETLFASEINVFNFYFNSKNYKAAQKRLDTLSKEYIPTLAAAEPKTLELTIQLAQAQNNTQGMLEAQFKLVSKYPDNDVTKNMIAHPEQIKLAWEDAYKVKQHGGMPTEAKTLLAEAQSMQPEKSLDLKAIAKDPLKPVEQPQVKVVQAKPKTQSA